MVHHPLVHVGRGQHLDARMVRSMVRSASRPPRSRVLPPNAEDASSKGCDAPCNCPCLRTLDKPQRRGNNSNQRLAFSSKSSSRRSQKRSRGREKSGWHPGARLEPRPSAAHHVAARHVAGGHGLVPRPVGRTPPRGGLRDLATPRYKKEPYIASPTATPCAASGPCRHPSPARARRPRAAPRTTTSPVVAAVCE
jgi:hypothetical protein